MQIEQHTLEGSSYAMMQESQSIDKHEQCELAHDIGLHGKYHYGIEDASQAEHPIVKVSYEVGLSEISIE